MLMLHHVSVRCDARYITLDRSILCETGSTCCIGEWGGFQHTAWHIHTHTYHTQHTAYITHDSVNTMHKHIHHVHSHIAAQMRMHAHRIISTHACIAASTGVAPCDVTRHARDMSVWIALHRRVACRPAPTCTARKSGGCDMDD